jgi:hypothetical protein
MSQCRIQDAQSGRRSEASRLRLRPFSASTVRALLNQHATSTGEEGYQTILPGFNERRGQARRMGADRELLPSTRKGGTE